MTQLEPFEIDPKTFLYQHCSLPPLSSVVTEVRDIIQKDDVSIAQVANIISGDPALVAEVLKVVNSAYYSFSAEIFDVKRAIAYLGINEVYRIVLFISVFNSFAVEEKNMFNNIWFHAVYSALCTKYIVRKFKPLLPIDEVWTAAILHDIGKLVYLKFFPEHYKALCQFCKENGCLFGEAEDHFSFPPTPYLGALLCDRWRLPIKVKKACASHRLKNLQVDETGKSSGSFTRMICLGNLTAILTTDNLNKENKEEIANAIMKALDLSKPDFLMLMGTVIDLKVEAEKFL